MIKETVEKHMIQKQVIEMAFDTISDGFGLQHRVSELFHEKLLPQMEMLFDEFADENHFISFETLYIDCGIVSRRHWEDEWIEETLKGLRRELLAANKKSMESNAIEKIQSAFSFFLQHGYLPWNSPIASTTELEQAKTDQAFRERLKHLIQAEPRAADRFVYSFSEAFVSNMIELLTNGKRERIADQLILLNEASTIQQKRVIQSTMVKALCCSKPVTEHTAKKKEDKPEGIYIHNAGLVILHPFLPELFKALDLTKDTSWKDEPSRHTAVIMLEYLASGSDECPEFDLPLNKIICGLSTDEVLKVEESLSEEIKRECDNMLRVVIQHWSALKNTGIDALRETFLQRYGRLTEVDNGWLLQVEQKPVDVLVNHLPWGIGTIRLPWMQDILYTEW